MIDYSYLHIKNTIPFLPGFHRSHKVFTHFSFKIFLKQREHTQHILRLRKMKRRRKRLMVIIPVAAVCVAGAGTVGYFKVAHTKPVQKKVAKT